MQIGNYEKGEVTTGYLEERDRRLTKCPGIPGHLPLNPREFSLRPLTAVYKHKYCPIDLPITTMRLLAQSSVPT